VEWGYLRDATISEQEVIFTRQILTWSQ